MMRLDEKNADAEWLRCPGFSGPIAQEFHLTARVAHFPGRMEVDAVFTTKIGANQAPGFKAAS